MQAVFTLLGVLLLLAAGAFGMTQSVYLQGGNNAPNVTAAGASCGFAIAGGLSFVAAALLERGGRRGD
jgi:hypothetical protein